MTLQCVIGRIFVDDENENNEESDMESYNDESIMESYDDESDDEIFLNIYEDIQNYCKEYELKKKFE